jgi:hypothetical protein
MCVAGLKQESRSRGLRSGGTKPQLLQRLLDDDAKTTDAQGDNSDSARAEGMAATANKRNAQAGQPRLLRCWDVGWHSRKGCCFGRNVFSFWDGFLSDFAFFDAKSIKKIACDCL